MRVFVVMAVAWLMAPLGALAAGCGVAPAQPKLPVGCQTMEPTCVCDAKGVCHWQFICVRQ